MEKSKTIKRLNIIKGQISWIIKMIEEEKECIKVLTQIKSVKNAFSSVSAKMVQEGMTKCVINKDSSDLEKIIKIFVN